MGGELTVRLRHCSRSIWRKRSVAVPESTCNGTLGAPFAGWAPRLHTDRQTRPPQTLSRHRNVAGGAEGQSEPWLQGSTAPMHQSRQSDGWDFAIGTFRLWSQCRPRSGQASWLWAVGALAPQDTEKTSSGAENPLKATVPTKVGVTAPVSSARVSASMRISRPATLV